MEISYAFFADFAQLTSDGKLNVLGGDVRVFPFPGPPPWVQPSIFLVISLILERQECGRVYRFSGDMIAPDGNRIAPYLENDFTVANLDDPELVGKLNILVQLGSVPFPQPGVYNMEVTIADRERNISESKRIRLRVVRTDPQNAPA